MVAGSIPSAGPWRPQCFSVPAKRRPFLLSPPCAERALVNGQ